MRRNLLHVGYKELSYEIREIVEIAQKVQSYGVDISWENIGDPVNKGEKVPVWIKDIIKKSLDDDQVFAYSPSKGLLKTRQYLASKTDNLSPDDIIFFNGLGEAINKTYGYLSFSARVLGPNPAYPTHSSSEATNSGSEHITYDLDPNNGWNPDLNDIENKVKYNPNIVAILVINPDNPTGNVFDKKILEGIIGIAKKYNLFVIFDEIYEKLTFKQEDRVCLSEIIGDVPGFAMKGISKDLPWPGARCGWIEVYNREKDENFQKYIDSIYRSKMLEVCSTTLPQYVLPLIYENPEYKKSLSERIEVYKKKAEICEEIFGTENGIIFVKPKGAYYISIVFDMDKIDENLVPDIEKQDLKKYIEDLVVNLSRFDKKFCYYLLGVSGICVVPLSGFNSTYNGFRLTLLEENDDKFRDILVKIRDLIRFFVKK